MDDNYTINDDLCSCRMTRDDEFGDDVKDQRELFGQTIEAHIDLYPTSAPSSVTPPLVLMSVV